MIERWVFDASPLILLGRLGLLGLIPALTKEWAIPAAVARELLTDKEDAVVEWLDGPARFHIVQVVTLDPSIQAFDLGAGETEVIGWARGNKSYRAVLDDRAARNCAAVFKIPVIGTVGILLLGKRRNLLAEVRPWLEKLHKSGCYLDPILVRHALDLAGEA